MKKILPFLLLLCAITNITNASTDVTTDITTNTTWNVAGSPYSIKAAITIAAGVTLTINPGVTVSFVENASLDVKGTLKASGTKALPINFQPAGNSGYYHGPVTIDATSTNTVLRNVNITSFYVPDAAIVIKSTSSCQIDSCFITSTRGNGIDIQNNSPATIKHSTFTGTTDYDVVLGINDLPKLSANNSPLALGITTQTMTANATLTTVNNYWFLGAFTVPAGITLTINPGVTVSFVENASLDVKGTLKASGTKALPINFQPAGNSGYYHGPVTIDATSTNTVLRNVNITSFYVPDAAIVIKSTSSCQIDSCFITSTRGNGIDIQNNSPATIKHSTFTGTTDYDVVLGINDLPKLSANNSPLALGITTQTMTANATLTTVNNYWFLGAFTVPAGITLTINPGVTVSFVENASLDVKGTLKASGTKALPINFQPAGNSGYYHGPVTIDATSTNTVLRNVNITSFYVPDAAIVIKSTSSCQIDSCFITSTRGNGIDIQNNSPATIKHSTFTGTTDYDVVLGINDLPKLSANNSPLALGITTQTMTANATLTTVNNYWFLGAFTVPAGITLTINPGVTVSFVENASLDVKGTLKASGTKALPINFQPAGNSGYYHGPVTIDATSTNTVLRNVNITSFYVPDAAIVIKSTSSCQIDSCFITSTRGNGIDIQNNSPATIKHSTFTGTTDYDVVLGINDLPKLSANNSPLALGITTQTMTANATLTTVNNYWFLGAFTVPAGITLTINPGVTVSFVENASLDVKGTLKASGTKALPINFQPAGNSGYYHGPVTIDATSTNTVLRNVNITSFYVPDAAIVIKSTSSCQIDSCFITSTRGNGIDIQNNSPIISNNRFSGNTNYDILANATSLSNFSDNDNAFIHIPAATIQQDVTWSNPGKTSQYVLNGIITLNESYKLTIAAGTTVDFQNNNGNLFIKGTLTAIGTKTNKILFTKTGSGYGGSVSFDSLSKGSLIYVITDKLGTATSPGKGAAVELNSKYPVTLRNDSIRNSENNGLSIKKGSPLVLTTNFTNNKNGVYSYAGKAVFTKCSFTGNTKYGVNNASPAPADTIDARNCWWDDPSGPYQSQTNPTGLGDSVTLKVLYKPFAKKPFEPNDIGVINILSPVSSCTLSNSEQVKVRIKNFGIEEQTGFNVSYKINNGPVVTENVDSLKIAADSTADFMFTKAADISSPGKSYTIKAFTALIGDTILSNDSSTNVIVNRKPNLGSDTAVKICKDGTINLWTLYDTTGYKTKKWSAPKPDSVKAGTYTLIVTNNSGCADTATAKVTTYPLNTPTIAASGNTTFCKGASVTLTSSPAPSYLWSNGAITQNIVVKKSGNYSVTTGNDSGCHATSAPTLVEVDSTAKPTITPSGSLNLCPKDSVTLTSSVENSYAWSNNAKTQSISVSVPGSYTVTVTGVNGCKNTSDPAVVTQTCDKPAQLKSTSVSATSEKLSWGVISCAVNYSLEYRKTGTTTWTTITVPNASYTLNGLTANTSYDWAVATICQSSPLIQSAYTAIVKFTTAASALSGSISYNENSSGTSNKLSVTVYPVPVVNNMATLIIKNGNGNATVTLSDISGKTIWTAHNIANGNLDLPVSKIATGVYVINVYSGKENAMVKLIKQ